MSNERLRAALLKKGMTPAQLAEQLGVDIKTAERWIGGRAPYRKYRFAVATLLGVDESYLWPEALPRNQVSAAYQAGDRCAGWDIDRYTCIGGVTDPHSYALQPTG